MKEFTLFGKKITFDASDVNGFEIRHRLWTSTDKAEEEFYRWYGNCGDILTVLKGVENRIYSLVRKYATQPLFQELSKIGIYDIGQTTYENECLIADSCIGVCEEAAEKYYQIIEQQQEEEEYREVRKAFNSTGLLSSIGQGLVNAVGNAGSALAASAAKSKLYDQLKPLLWDALSEDLLSSYQRHINLVNERKKDYYSACFDEEKSDALFENAKKVPGKRQELLQDAFYYCPWSEELLKYIFVNYAEERGDIWRAANWTHVDLNETAQQAFANMYTQAAQTNEKQALIVKAEIVRQMQMCGIKSSPTVDQIETDCLNRILKEYPEADKEKREEIFNAVIAFDAKDPIKRKVLHKNLVWELAKKYGVVFTTEEAESILGKVDISFVAAAPDWREKATQAKTAMQEIMQALSVADSTVFNNFEVKCIERILKDYPTEDLVKKEAIFAEVDAFAAKESNKQSAIRKLLVWELAKKYHVTFTTEEVETLLGKINTDQITPEKKWKPIAQQIKASFLEIMQALDVQDSTTFDEFEKKCLAIVSKGYGKADEATCNKLRKAVNAYDALEKNKKPFLDSIQARIESIWSAEDGEVFDNIFLQTNIKDPQSKQEAIDFIEKKKRTRNGDRYLKALRGCTQENIAKAHRFQKPWMQSLDMVGIGVAVLAVILWIICLGFWTSLLIAAVGIALIIWHSKQERIWNDLTLDGTLVHAMLSADGKEHRKPTEKQATNDQTETEKETK